MDAYPDEALQPVGRVEDIGADDTLRAAVVQKFGRRVVQPDGLLELGDEAIVFAGKDFLRLGGKPAWHGVAKRRRLGIGLGRPAKWFISLGVDGAVADDELLVEGGSAFQDEAVGGSAKSQLVTA